ncbi:MAG: nuclease [Acidobacteriaceae bacterium]
MPGNQPAAHSHPAAPPTSIATVATEGVSVSGSLSVSNGRATIGNDGAITAGDQSTDVALTRGGHLKVCSTTKIHLSTDKATPGGALMIALDRGALEAHYTTGQYSDVLLTPDLRILISPPGLADLSIRVNSQGDTCVDNHGEAAPYVLASSLFDGGAYRVQPNQRVLFEHGSLRDVVDNEQDPCGCPPALPVSVASTGKHGANPAQPGQKVSSAAQQNPFPLAESEGLKPAPPLPTTPVVPPGQAHVEVSAPIAFDANNPNPPPALPPAAPAENPTPVPTSAITVAQAPRPPAPPHTGFFHHIGRFFKKLFGG